MSVEDDLLFWLSIVVYTLSIIACIFSLLIYIFAKHLRIYPFKLVFWLNLFDLIRSLAQIFPVLYASIPQDICSATAFFYVFSCFETNYWSLIIAYTIYQVLVKKNFNVESKYKILIWFGLGSGILLSIIPIFFDSYGKIYLGCSLVQSFQGEIFKLLIIYIPGLTIACINTSIFVKVYFVLKNNENEIQELEEINAEKLFYYPAILLLCLFPGMVMRIVEFARFNFIELTFLAYTTWGLQGFFNALAYSLSKPVKEYISECFCKKKGVIKVTDQSLIEIDKS
ncbi:hypothetical protein SteCoe_19670 [Stentor coeruleus]|uniref:G-protein coupled receptors family 2 profile 2 domain-containing protein n=1 Tax=Stentor coeruleus TaxID=5963 RepID=A0A1R2BTI1_9CILI|nr:hypothetical protein SteCoe_19670 [Stentor coeruleus]